MLVSPARPHSTRRRRLGRVVLAPVATVALALASVGIGSGAAGAAPASGSGSSAPSSESGGSSAAPSTVPRPTVDASQPSPTEPYPGGPPVGTAPDGSTVGGAQLATRGLVVQPGSPVVPGITAAGWLVADLDLGVVIGAQDPHGRYYPASTLKTLTLASLYPELDPNLVVFATAEDANIEGSRVGIVDGGQYTVHQLALGLMLQSGNDAANALARTYGGVPKTVELMNHTAEDLRAYDTIVGTPSGLDVVGQSSSPYDLCLFIRAIVHDPKMLEVASTKMAALPAAPPDYPSFQFQNQNKLLWNYDGTLAGKTGFTDAARHTFVGAAKRNGRTLAVALMQGEQSPLPMWEQAAAMLDWGFSQTPSTTGVGTLPPTQQQAAASSSSAAADAASESAALASESAAAATSTAERNGAQPGGPLVPIGIGAGVVVVTGLGMWWEFRRRRRGEAE